MRTYPFVETPAGSGLEVGWYLGNSLMTLRRQRPFGCHGSGRIADDVGTSSSCSKGRRVRLSALMWKVVAVRMKATLMVRKLHMSWYRAKKEDANDNIGEGHSHRCLVAWPRHRRVRLDCIIDKQQLLSIAKTTPESPEAHVGTRLRKTITEVLQEQRHDCG